MIKGKKVVGYHLPQKIADLGLMGELDEEPKKEATPEKHETSPTVPNALKETEKGASGVQAPKPDKKKSILQIEEAYDIAKVFNA